jgi:predicted enzyme related to lactoylglutathione lyase
MPTTHLVRSALPAPPWRSSALRRRSRKPPRRRRRKGRTRLRPPTVNAQQEARIPGKFIWFDLVTPEPYASKAFYGIVFNWDFHSIGSGAGRYTLIENKGRNIGGMHFRPSARATRGPRDGSRWLALMSVSDPAAAAKYVEAHGGKVLVAPTRFEGRGTHALFRDDEGAVFGVLTSDSGDPPEGAPISGEFLWLDLFSRDPQKSAEFYRGLAGYDVTTKQTSPQTVRIGLATAGVTRASILTMPKEVTQAGLAAVRANGRRCGGG